MAKPENIKKDPSVIPDEPRGSSKADQTDADNAITQVPEKQENSVKRIHQRLSLDIEYAKDWTMADGFLEVCQNWTDGIMHSSGLSREKLSYVRSEINNGFRYIVYNPDRTQMLGFLAFCSKKGISKVEGTLEFCNYGSKLPLRALNMGWTSKGMNDNLAGKHGEGLKIAALIMLRDGGHRTRFTASGYYWNLQMGPSDKQNDKDALCCSMTKIATKPSEQDDAKNLDKLQFRIPSPWDDVSVKIGNPIRNEGKSIAEEEVSKWLKLYLYFDCPKKLIDTKYGRILLEEKFGSQIYFKGLLLKQSSIPSRYKYGYDLSQGSIDRNRNMDDKQLKSLLANIWDEAIKDHGGEIVDLYLGIFEETQSDWWDVKDSTLSESAAKSIWKRLRGKNPQNEKFYHGQNDAYKTAAMIETSLKKEPVLLPEAIWELLREHTHAQTPLEYQREELINASVAEANNKAYSRRFQRLLGAALSMDPRTKFDVVIKEAGDIKLDLHLNMKSSTPQILLHNKFLDFDQSHAESILNCLQSQFKGPEESFTCDHFIVDIYDRILQELDGQGISMK